MIKEKSKIRECDQCGESFTGEALDHMVELDDEWYCPDCRDDILFVCDKCGEFERKHKCFSVTESLAGERTYCEHCYDNHTEKCASCGNVWLDDDLQYHKGEGYCESCWEDNFASCDVCGDTILINDAITCDDGVVCESCFDEHYFICTRCGYVGPSNRACVDNYGEYYCVDCYSDLHTSCDRCGCEISAIDDAIYNENGVYCNDCYSVEEGGEMMYHFTYHRTDRDSKDEPYMGIELEVVPGKGQNISNPISKARGCVTNEQLFDVHMDGSVSEGAEIVSAPCTYSYLQDNYDAIWGDTLRNLHSAGFRSYGYSDCGIHIHLSLSAFHGNHLLKFTEFIYCNRDLVELVAQRHSNNYAEWECGNPDEIAIKVRDGKYDYELDRYAVLNLTNGVTAELRIFKGNLTQSSFRKNIEFCHAVFKFTKEKASRFGRVFYRWLIDHEKEYEALTDYLLKKGVLNCVLQS